MLTKFELKIPVQLEPWQFAKLADLVEKLEGRWVKTEKRFVFHTAVPVVELLGMSRAEGGPEDAEAANRG